MENDFEIEILDEKKEQKGEAQLPLNFQALGEIEQDDVKVYIRQDVYKALEKYSREDVKNERGTFLLGECREEMGKLHVIISAYIEARYTDAAAATLTFTHETWDYVHKEQEKKYPNLKILGWQHTHPSYGIFLSSYDLFIHENFFDLPYQIAYVIDPVQNLRGFFQWKQGKVVKLNGYYVYDEVGKPIKIEQRKPKKENGNLAAGKRSRGWTAAVVLALMLGAAGLASSLMMWKKMERQAELLDQQNRRQITMEQQTQNLDGAGAGTERSESSDPNDDENHVLSILDALTERQDEQQARIDEQQAAIEALQAALGNGSGQTADEGEMISYTVKAGDTLSSICAAHNIDFVRNKKEIMELNGIENENVIYVGQVLQLPTSLQR